jgi:hypothetical protein
MTPRSTRFGRLSVAALSVITICAFSTSTRAKPQDLYDTPKRSDAELARLLVATCERAQSPRRPLLIEFSAAWCSDCLELQLMKQEPALASELDRWPMVVINVGEFEQHPDLLEAFAVRRIARWVVTEPTDCKHPAASWTRLASRTLEPVTGEASDLTPAALAAWLESLRKP